MEALMGCINYKYPRGGLPAVLLTAVLIFGCSSKVTQKDPFFEKWSTAAETQTGYSPVTKERGGIRGLDCIGLDVVPNDVEDTQADTSTKSLPVKQIHLKMVKEDIKTVLRALALEGGINIIVGGKNEIKGEITVNFRDVPWDQAFKSLLASHGLTYAWEGDIVRVKTAADRKDDVEQKTQKAVIKSLERLITCVIPIYNLILTPTATATRDISSKMNLEKTAGSSSSERTTKITDIEKRDYSNLPEILASFLSGSGSVGVDTIRNAVIIQATPDDLKKMIPLIEKLDTPRQQIQIQANIVETTKEMARQLGIQWGGMYARTVGSDNLYINPGGTRGSATSPGSALAGTYTPTYGTSGMSGQGYGVNFPISSTAMTTAGGAASLGLMFGSIGGNILDMQLSALQRDSKLNILSSPSITTLDNQEASTENGEKVPYVTYETSSGTTTKTVKFEEAVLRLKITPHVIDEKTLSMKILVQKDEVDPIRNVDGNPYIIKKKTETNLNVRSGETIVISGLTKQRTLGGDTGVPGLKNIPVLGWLFKNDDTQEKMEEVLIFITPKILPAMDATVKSSETMANPANSNRSAGSAAGEKPVADKTPQP
jgi:type IV pilus assembly protein PilQ